MCRQSCTITMNATVIETRTATGAAVSTGTVNTSSGTATRASPNPKADRMMVARNKTATTSIAIMDYNTTQSELESDLQLHFAISSRAVAATATLATSAVGESV